jgi:uncharacterized membrane protein
MQSFERSFIVEQKSLKGQKGFAIVNIIVGVILTIAGFIMFSDPSVGPGGIISVTLGVAIWVIGACTLYAFKNSRDNESKIKRIRLMNTICFVLSCVVLGAVIVLPIIAPML